MYRSIANILDLCAQTNQPLFRVILNTEIDSSNRTEEDLTKEMSRRLEIMRSSVEKGLRSPIVSISGLTKGNAYGYAQFINQNKPSLAGNFLQKAMACAMAVGEVNAGMGCIVATPTAGSSGVLPAILFTMQEYFSISNQNLVNALFTAGGVGAVIMHRANTSGAAGGCQAETGSAAAMAAAAAVELLGGTPNQSAHAVAITLTNMLGLVCDPVAGLVEIPCIKRNAGAVAQCVAAVDLAMAGIESAIPVDEVIDAMESIGRRMDERFRETAQGGLAATPTGKLIAEQIWGKIKN
jgi:L-serine dehydratase